MKNRSIFIVTIFVISDTGFEVYEKVYNNSLGVQPEELKIIVC